MKLVPVSSSCDMDSLSHGFVSVLLRMMLTAQVCISFKFTIALGGVSNPPAGAPILRFFNMCSKIRLWALPASPKLGPVATTPLTTYMVGVKQETTAGNEI